MAWEGGGLGSPPTPGGPPGQARLRWLGIAAAIPLCSLASPHPPLSLPIPRAGGQAVHDPPVYLLDYLPPEQRLAVEQQFAVGFGGLFRTCRYLLGQGQLPRPKMVATCATLTPGVDKAAAKFFLDHGGLPEFALDGLLASAEADMEQQHGGALAADAELASRLAATPECSNDSAVQELRQQLFLNSDFWPCGPYEFDDEAQDGDGWVFYDTSAWQAPGAGHK